ncbi:hypothetical protein CEXT_429841, partial [Caerostris extrusa]
PEKSDKIIIGSHSGILRIYKPQLLKNKKMVATLHFGRYLLFRNPAEISIIHLGTGVLSSTLINFSWLSSNHLNFLFSVSAVHGSVEHGTHLNYP